MEKQRSQSSSLVTRGLRARSRTPDDAHFSDLRRCGCGGDFESFTSDHHCRRLDFPDLDYRLQSMHVSRISGDMGTTAAHQSSVTRSLVI
ncbi:hypothetical protein TIFTF001_045822 [Ficus carica]|uniref:Uncharacterized protein n=1 Tax=Ficus carica TaxID=3494 RepID=A0AA87YWY8_FICCA|nr:hypothetical protein TIFTF001_045821 [Ficus carica]GMN23897.1 hypothetical protein TIFTF001_045822 [Ficus carica]